MNSFKYCHLAGQNSPNQTAISHLPVFTHLFPVMFNSWSGLLRKQFGVLSMNQSHLLGSWKQAERCQVNNSTLHVKVVGFKLHLTCRFSGK